ncbi:MAG: trigger factor [Rhodothermales bacterium]|nr:trigger factor [Rhodothermales bacterium]
MDTTIKQVSSVEYELEISATADELAPDLNSALKTQRARTKMKGFRTGKVPLSIVKKMYGEALAYGIAEKSIQEKFETEVVEAETHDVVGKPKLTRFEYKLDGDLSATIRFGVKPTFELEDISTLTVNKMVHGTNEEDVDAEIERLQKAEADLTPFDAPAGDNDYVVMSMQALDDESGTPIIGEKQDDMTVHIGDDRLKSELRTALIGMSAGETRRVDIAHDEPHDHGDEHHGDSHTHSYEIEVKEVKKQELPDLDDEFVKSVSKGEVETVDAFKEEIRKQLASGWEQRSRELLESSLMLKILDLHDIEIPDSIIDIYLDSFVEDVIRRNQGKAPEGFNEDAFRFANRDEAEQQAKWMLIRERLVETENLDVTDDEMAEFFKQSSEGGGFSPEDMEAYYRSMPALMDGLKQRQMSKKVFDFIESKVTIVELDKDAYEEAEKEETNQED